MNVSFKDRVAVYSFSFSFDTHLKNKISENLTSKSLPTFFNPTDPARNKFKKHKIIINLLPCQHCIKFFNCVDENMKNWQEYI